MFAPALILTLILYPGRESNPHFLNENRILSPACLPVPPPGHLLLKIASQKDHLDSKQINLLVNRHVYLFVSGRPSSNRLPQPWQGRALPNELLPLVWTAKVNINLKIQTQQIKKIYYPNFSPFFTCIKISTLVGYHLKRLQNTRF